MRSKGRWEEVYQCVECDHVIGHYEGWILGEYYEPCPECGGKFVGITGRPIYDHEVKSYLFGLIKRKKLVCVGFEIK